MNYSVITGLLQNVSILLAFAILYGFFKISIYRAKHFLNQIGFGIVIGIFGIFLISTPWINVPGITFDTRSVLLSVTGLFFGPVPTFIAMLETGAFRIFIGGDGVNMGLAVIVTSGSVGLLWRHFRPNWEKNKYHLELITMGFVVHFLMILCVFLLPSEMVFNTMKKIAFIVVAVYPLITLLVGAVIKYQLKTWNIKQELDLTEQRWKFATEGVGDGVWDWNFKTDEIYFSKIWKEMLGYNETEVGNTLNDWVERVHPDDIDQAQNGVNNHLKGLTPEYQNEHRLLCKDGTYKWILDRGKIIERDENGNPSRLIGTHTDISERKKTEKELHENRNFLNSIINNIHSFIYVTDLAGKFILVNHKFERVFQLQNENIIDNPREVMMSKEFAEQHRKNDLLVIDSGNSITLEEENMEADGKHYYQTEKFPLYDENNKIFAVGGISTDLTERKKVEEEIIRLNNQLEQKVEERTKELESKISEIQRMNDLFIGRELRMIELKEKIKILEDSLNDKTKN